jgi:hypothetical protein
MSSGAALAQAPAKKPNVVVIMADGVGWSDFGVYRGGMRLGRGEGMTRLLHFARLFEGDPLSLLALRGAGSKM